MAFTIQNIERSSAGANEPIYTLADASISGCWREYNYYTADTQVVAATASYFDDYAYNLATGDYVTVESSTDGNKIAYKVTNTSGVITLTFVAGQASSKTTLTNAQFVALFTTSIELLPSPGAGRMYVLEHLQTTIDYSGAVLTNGGPYHVQYGDTAAGLGVQASTETAAADINGAAADSSWLEIPVLLAVAAKATHEDLGLYAAVRTADFTAGLSTSTFIVNCSAKIVPTA